jgi:electron transfer flavoprotein alpha subunit
MKTLVIAENQKNAMELCAGARRDGEVVLFAYEDSQVVRNCANKIAQVSLPDGCLADDVAATLATYIGTEGFDRVFVEPTRRLKNIIGQAAALLKTAVITNAFELDGTAGKNLYFGGIAEKTQKPLGQLGIYTVGPGTFADETATGGAAIEAVEWVAPRSAAALLGTAALPKATVNLPDAKVIVAAGRGFTEESQLGMARNLCSRIGGELGCTRPIAETERWLPKEAYIGVSGLMLSPEVYVGVGVSGQMQHMVGVKRAKTVFAINKDKTATIFKQADYGLVGEIATVLPELLSKL